MNDRPAAVASSGATALALTYHGTWRELLPIVLQNTLLNIVTLSFYRFWARTRVRRYLWSRTRLNGEPFEYTGTGRELFIGFLIVFFVVILPLGLLSGLVQFLIVQQQVVPAVLLIVGLGVAVVLLTGVAVYRAQRYRLSRTLWRGVRFGLTGSSIRYALSQFGFYLLLPFSFGWTYPWMRVSLFGRRMSNTWFGSHRFGFARSYARLYNRFTFVWLGIIGVMTAFSLILGGIAAFIAFDSDGPDGANPSDEVGILGAVAGYVPVVIAALVWFAYQVAEFRHLVACTHADEGVRFRLSCSYWQMLRLTVGNMLISVFTLTFGQPFAQQRVFRFVCEKLEIAGEADLEAVRQSSLERPRTGEGLADAFDMGEI